MGHVTPHFGFWGSGQIPQNGEPPFSVHITFQPKYNVSEMLEVSIVGYAELLFPETSKVVWAGLSVV